MGEVVARDKPTTKHGLYWGYTVRVAKSLSEVSRVFPIDNRIISYRYR